MTDETVPVIRELAQFLAELVYRHVLLYDRVHRVNGKRYRVTIQEYKSPEDTQPFGTIRRVDEDDGIAD